MWIYRESCRPQPRVGIVHKEVHRSGMGIRQSVAEYVAEIGAYYEQYINQIHENGINLEYLEYVAEKYPLDMMDKVLESIFNDLNILNRVHKMVLRFKPHLLPLYNMHNDV